MRDNDKTGDPDRLRALLRRGDPAAGEEEFPEPTAARMRARIVAAAMDRPRVVLGPFAWATAAAAGVVLLLAIWARPEAPAPTPTPHRESPAAAEPAPARPVPVMPAPAPPRQQAPPTRTVPAPEGAQRGAGPRVASAPAQRLEAAPPAGSNAADAAKRRPLNVQFTTPAGTRIIWTLDPEFKG